MQGKIENVETQASLQTNKRKKKHTMNLICGTIYNVCSKDASVSESKDKMFTFAVWKKTYIVS